MDAVSAQFSDYESAKRYVTDNAPDADYLPSVTAHCDDDLHSVWLDKTTGTVWHAWTEPGDVDSWTLDQEPASVAQQWIEDQITWVLDRLANPEHGYADAGPYVTVENDLDTLAEWEDVQLAGIRKQSTGSTDPIVVDRIIRGRIISLNEEVSRLSRLRGRNLADAYGMGHGSAAAASRELHISNQAASRTMASVEEYATKARDGYEKARKLTEGTA